MEKRYKWEKNELKFDFILTGLNDYENLVFKWKIEGSDHAESEWTEDGYFYNARLHNNEKQILCTFKIGNKKLEGVNIPEEFVQEIIDIKNNLLNIRNKKINDLVEEIVSGKKLINFSIVGCDYPHYQAWLENIDVELKGQVQEIMGKAIKRILPHVYFANSCEYIRNSIKCSIQNVLEMEKKFGNKIKNIKCNEDVVTYFEMKLNDCIEAEEKLKAEKKRIEIIEEMKLKAKETGEKQIYMKWVEPCNDSREECNVDVVYEYIMPDGTFSTERQHSW